MNFGGKQAHARTCTHVASQWMAGGMRAEIFISNAYSAEGTFVSFSTTLLQFKYLLLLK